MLTTNRRIASLSIGVACALAIGGAAQRFDHRVRDGVFVGFAGNQAALDRGMKACQEILRDDPKHAEAMVWHGTGVFSLSGSTFKKAS